MVSATKLATKKLRRFRWKAELPISTGRYIREHQEGEGPDKAFHADDETSQLHCDAVPGQGDRAHMLRLLLHRTHGCENIFRSGIAQTEQVIGA